MLLKSMLKHKISWVFVLLLYSIAASAQQKNTSLELQFNFSFLEQPLELQTPYKLPDGHSLIFTKIQFYLGNVKLENAQAEKISMPQKYYLVALDEDTHQTSIILDNIAKKHQLAKIQFSVGIDSVSNHSGKQVGALDPLYGMFWTWSQGYIFFKVEGYYITKEGVRGGFVYHIGGNDCFRTITLKLGESITKTKQTLTYPIQIKLERLFGLYENPAVRLKIPEDNKKISVMGGPQAPFIADNFMKAFQEL